MIGKTIIGIFVTSFGAIMLLSVLPDIVTATNNSRSDSSQQTLTCQSDVNGNCPITLPSVHANENMEGIEVIENTSTTDMTSNSSIDDTSKIITVSGLPTSPVQTYQFNVTYLKLADGVNPTTNSLIRLLPIGIIFGIMGVTTFGLMSRM
jgi:hypothetical protein